MSLMIIYYVYAKWEMDIDIYWKIVVCWKLPNTQTPRQTRQEKTRQDKIWRGGIQARKCPLFFKNYVLDK